MPNENDNIRAPAFLKEVFVSAALRQAQEGIARLDERYAAEVMAQVNEFKIYMQRIHDPEALAEIDGARVQEIGFRPKS